MSLDFNVHVKKVLPPESFYTVQNVRLLAPSVWPLAIGLFAGLLSGLITWISPYLPDPTWQRGPR